MTPGAGAIMAERPLTEYQAGVHGRLISVSRPAGDLSVAAFLRQGRGRQRFYWRDGRSDVTVAGLGAAVELMGWGETRFSSLQRQARELFDHELVWDCRQPLAAPRLFGGFAFGEDFAPDVTWAAFKPAHFILPHFQLAGQGEQRWLTINALLPPGEDPAGSRAVLLEALEARYHDFKLQTPSLQPATEPGPAGSQVSYPLAFPEWAAMIDAARAVFASSPLRKVVLSRVCEVRQPQAVDVDSALAHLESRYPDCYTFLFEPRPRHAFFGATPELLARVQGRDLCTAGLAGSAPRGATPEEDRRNVQALLASAKDRHEHQLVVESIRRRLAPVAAALRAPQTPQVLTLSNIHHLYTPMSARLLRRTGVLPLVEILHPTPAMGGTPRELALEFIRRNEPTLRGWYAAPVGWIDHSLDGAFAVAIRSAVAQERRVWLYAGAGIVPASLAEREWQETGWKFRPILEALERGNVGTFERGNVPALERWKMNHDP